MSAGPTCLIRLCFATTRVLLGSEQTVQKRLRSILSGGGIGISDLQFDIMDELSEDVAHLPGP